MVSGMQIMESAMEHITKVDVQQAWVLGSPAKTSKVLNGNYLLVSASCGMPLLLRMFHRTRMYESRRMFQCSCTT